jgi:ribosomal protein L40E
MSNPRCFISYSWDNSAHKDWVRGLAETLQAYGVKVYFDQWDLSPGSDVLQYMEQSVRDSDYVLLICTPTFAQKANAGQGGVGYEKTIITGEIFHLVAPDTKFVPLLRFGNVSTSLPSYLRTKVFIDFRDESDPRASLDELLRHIYASPRFVRPPIGKAPQFGTTKYSSQSMLTEKRGRADRYCRRCGAAIGSPSTCIGMYTMHDFIAGRGHEYCRRCGAVVGSPSTCIGMYTMHDFIAGRGHEYCRRCGAVVGSSSTCIGMYTTHDFVAG